MIFYFVFFLSWWSFTYPISYEEKWLQSHYGLATYLVIITQGISLFEIPKEDDDMKNQQFKICLT